jgi:putative FmdB family regulatory protein
MPFYEYECSNCKFYTELLQKVSDPPLKKCPSCKKTTMKKLVSAPVFRLKGAGWYETDFKSDKEGRRNLALDKEPAANDSSIESKPAEPKAGEAKATESKPAAAASASDAKATASAPATASRSRRSVAKRPKPKPKAKSRSRSKRR